MARVSSGEDFCIRGKGKGVCRFEEALLPQNAKHPCFIFNYNLELPGGFLVPFEADRFLKIKDRERSVLAD
jgi:hypothetical protein